MFRSIQAKGERGGGAEIPIAPLIDIICILLFFFLVTAQFSREMGVEVKRPQARVTEAVQFLNGREAFRAAVMAKVWQWRFLPAFDGGRPLKVWGIKQVIFVIRQG